VTEGGTAVEPVAVAVVVPAVPEVAPVVAAVLLVGAGAVGVGVVPLGVAVLGRAADVVGVGTGAVVGAVRVLRACSMAGCAADGASGARSDGASSPAPTTTAARPEAHSRRRPRRARCRPGVPGVGSVSRSGEGRPGANTMRTT
jgi:hypothetical protein